MTAEATGKTEESLESSFLSVQNLKENLIEKYPALVNINFKVAVNQSIVTDDYQITGNEEIAFLPPFSGG